MHRAVLVTMRARRPEMSSAQGGRCRCHVKRVGYRPSILHQEDHHSCRAGR